MEFFSKFHYSDNDIKDINNKPFERIASCNTIDSTSNKEEIPDDLECLIEDLINGKIGLNDIPDNIKSLSNEILNIPKAPRKPENWECCGSGCCPCVWDIYDRDLEIHERKVSEISEKICSKK